jgi:VWFA-related protein
MRSHPFLTFALLAALAHGQAPPAANSAAEVSTQEDSVLFQSRVNLVLVPVVVRDKAGKAVDNLRQQDFQLFDKGKAQAITKFSVEKPGGKMISRTPAVEAAPGETAPETSSILAPDHFVAFLFDDVHIQFANLVQTREAAEKHIANNLKPTDRVAIYTTSGRTTLEFTDDRDLLRRTLLQLAPLPLARAGGQQCPDISYYQADLITNKRDDQALNAAVLEVMSCLSIPERSVAVAMAQSAASQVFTAGQHETRISLLNIKNVVRRLSLMPGRRTVILASPGFLRMSDNFEDEAAIIDQAIRSGVTINSLDARGLYTNMPDIAKRTISVAAEQVKQQIDRASASAEADILAELADGTGGTFVQNTNDLVRGLRELSAAPDTYYVLGFSPQNLKADGTYHTLKVTVKIPPGLALKARRGYYAPKHLASADEQAKEEISQALFSREEIHDIPVDMHTQFFKSSGTEARLVIVSRVDVRKLRFRKADGRNADEVEIVSGLFDRNGNYLQGVSKTLKMRLLEGTLESKLNAGISVRSDFKVAPGTYVIRLVVRDAEGQMMAAQNGAVEIP